METSHFCHVSELSKLQKNTNLCGKKINPGVYVVFPNTVTKVPGPSITHYLIMTNKSRPWWNSTRRNHLIKIYSVYMSIWFALRILQVFRIQAQALVRNILCFIKIHIQSNRSSVTVFSDHTSNNTVVVVGRLSFLQVESNLLQLERSVLISTCIKRLSIWKVLFHMVA